MFKNSKIILCFCILFSTRQPLTSEEIEQKREAIRTKKLEEPATIPGEKSEPAPVKESAEVDDSVECSSEKHEFLAFARVFSGTLRRGQTLFILSPKHNPEDFINMDVITFKTH